MCVSVCLLLLDLRNCNISSEGKHTDGKISIRYAKNMWGFSQKVFVSEMEQCKALRVMPS